MKNRKLKTLATVALALCLLAGTATTALAADYSGPEWGPLPDSGSFGVSNGGSAATVTPDKNYGGSGNSSSVTGGAASSGTTGSTTLQSEADFIQAHVDRVNYYRRQAGLSEVTLDPQLAEIAQARMNENNGSLSHNRPDGTGFWTIFDEYSTGLKPTGENISAVSANAAGVADGFYNSDGHRSIMLNEDAEYIGIGLEYIDNGIIKGYAVLQLYAKDA